MTAQLPELAPGDFYYQDLGGGRFRSTIHAQGAWNVHEQHMAPASGLMADLLERHEPRTDMRMARLSDEILGLIPGGEFQIGVMRTDGSGERILTSGFLEEGPTWAPNGRVLMFFRETAGSGGPKLFSIDLTGRNEQAIPTPTFASDPAWSPLLE